MGTDAPRMEAKVGITGASGIVGKVLTDALASEYDLTLYYRNTRIEREQFKRVRVDFSREDETMGVFDGLDAVIHLAADPHPATAWDTILSANIVATYNVMEEARRAGVPRVVFASTNHVQQGQCMLSADQPSSVKPFYVRRLGQVRLSDPPSPNSYYAVSKLFGEQLGRYYSAFFGMRFVALRMGSTFDNDDPSWVKGTPGEDYVRAMYLSHRDCAEAFRAALRVDTDYLLAYAVSDNDRRLYDMTETIKKLGFAPRDNSESFFG